MSRNREPQQNSANAEELVTVELYDSRLPRSTHGMIEGSSGQMDDSIHGGNVPLMTYSTDMWSSIARHFRIFYFKRPRAFGALIVLVFVGLPLLIFVIALALKMNSAHDASAPKVIINGDDDSTSNTIDWSKFSITSKSGVVATDNSLCSKVGASMLSRGGNAVDAAVASALCLGVVSPGSSGIGGGCYMLIYDSDSDNATFIDSREMAPTGSYETMYVSDPMKAQDGGLAIAVLAELKGLYYAHQHFGSGVISWADLVSPAADLAMNWTISPYVAHEIELVEYQLKSGDYPLLAELYLKDDGTLKTTGDWVTQPQLSQTLRSIAEKGSDYIYKELAAILAQEVQDAGGIITEQDIRSYDVRVSKPVTSETFGYTYLGAGGTSSGGAVVAGILQFLSGYKQPIASMGEIFYHRLAEAMKHMFAIRSYLGDPAFVNISEPLTAMLTPDYIDTLRDMTKDNAILDLWQYGGPRFPGDTPPSKEDHGTSHLSVVSQTQAVAMTSTINTYFGSKVISKTSGILFNNQMDDFSIPNSTNYFGLKPFPTNYPRPGKRPLSSMSPFILLENDPLTISDRGRVRLVGGASGGPKIITATAQVILNYLGKGMSLLDAVIAPRIHNQLVPNETFVERRVLANGDVIEMPQSVYANMKDRGQIAKYSQPLDSFGVSQMISISPDQSYTQKLQQKSSKNQEKHLREKIMSQNIGFSNYIEMGVSDPRKGGTPAKP